MHPSPGAFPPASFGTYCFSFRLVAFSEPSGDSTWLENVLGRRRQRHLWLNPPIIKRAPQNRAFNPGAGFA